VLTLKELATIAVPVLVMSGDDDVTTLSHTVEMYQAIPEAQLAVLPGTSHAVLKERTKECVKIIERFLHRPDSAANHVPPSTPVEWPPRSS